MTRQQLIDICLSYGTTYLDYPFDENWSAMRHNGTKKVFAFIFEHKGLIWLNVKVDVIAGQMWCDNFKSIVPAYHMNKLHWVSVIMDGTVPTEIIKQLIDDSFNITNTIKIKSLQK